jgi:hypothetical protein
MLFEYAVEPAAMGADWATFRYLFEKFGVEQGRIVSRLPSKWEKKVIQAAKEAGVPDIRMASIVERLRSTKMKVFDFGRSYAPEKTWMENALQEHTQTPFCAIIYHGSEKPCAQSITSDECSDENILFKTPISRNVPRTANDIAEALIVLARSSREIEIVDPFFDLRPEKGNYLAPMTSLFSKLFACQSTTKVIRVHFRSHTSRPPDHMLARDARRLTNGMIPPGYSLELFEWSQVPGGEDFHDRFFLTDVGGIMIGAGLSATGPNETAAFTLLNESHVRELRARFAETSTVYLKIGSAIRIESNGKTTLF